MNTRPGCWGTVQHRDCHEGLSGLPAGRLAPGPLPAHTEHNRAVPAAKALSELGVRPKISRWYGGRKTAERRGLARLCC